VSSQKIKSVLPYISIVVRGKKSMAVQDAYEKYYKIRTTGEDGLNIIVSMPRIVIEKEARQKGLTIKQFIGQYHAVAQYNSFEGVRYMFKEKNKKEESNENCRRNQK